jgi:Protein of unknown function (DUF2637)
MGMERLRNLALRLIVILNVIATVVAFGESYSGLFQWAIQHQITGFWGGIWPLMVDVIVLIAEAGLFVAHHDKWRTRHKAWLWTVMMVALGVSVGGNTGHIHSTDFLTHLTASLPPLALAFSLTVGFGVMKRTFLNKPKPAVVPVTEQATPLLAARAQDGGARAHVGESPWVSAPELATVMTPVAGSQTPPAPASHTSSTPPLTETEKAAPQLPADDFELSDTLLAAGLKVTDKSFTQPKDPRKGLDLKRKRVRDMYDIDPDISVNAISAALGIAWATAAKYRAETKEARGLELTPQEQSYLTSTASS